jgi:hypothetical protein
MRRAVAALALAAAACGTRSADEVPPELQHELVFVEKTLQLQPDDRAPTFTLRVPTIWELDRALVGHAGGQSVLVNGVEEPLHDEEFSTNWIDPEMHNGQFKLVVTCAGACGDAFVSTMFDSYRTGLEVLDEQGPVDGDHMQITRKDERTYAMRAWRVPGDDRWRVCWVSVGKRYQAAYRAFARSCADAVEHPRRS